MSRGAQLKSIGGATKKLQYQMDKYDMRTN